MSKRNLSPLVAAVFGGILIGFSPAADIPDSIRTRQQQRIDTIAAIAPSVVCVMPPDGQGGGSGVLISADGYAISNYHVTSGSGNFMKCGLNDGKVYDAVIVGIDPTGDVALIKLLGRDDFPFCTPGNSDLVRMGDDVVALGNPFLLASDFTPTVTYGIVSGVHRYQYPAGTFLEYTDCIQIDASINPGNSGGPLFDINGKWIGINGRASFEKRGRINTGAAYAISVRQVLLFVNHLKSGRIVDHGRTEFTVETNADGVVEVSQISQLAESYRRGLRQGDELVSFAGRSLSSANDFKNILGILPEGARVPLTFRNSDGVHRCTVRLMPLHGFEEAPELPEERKSRKEEKDENPEETPDEKPGTSGQEKAAVPEQYAKLFEAKKGYANYYFNKQHQDRLLKALAAKLSSEHQQPNQKWALMISTRNKANGELGVGPNAAYLQMVNGRSSLQPRKQYKPENEPFEYPGLLAGMLQIHNLLQNDRSFFSELFYHGDETLAPSGQEVDVLVTLDGTIKSRWYFADSSPLPVGVDIQLEAGIDEARVRFNDWSKNGSNFYPARIGVVDPEIEQVRWLDVITFEATKAAEKNTVGIDHEVPGKPSLAAWKFEIVSPSSGDGVVISRKQNGGVSL